MERGIGIQAGRSKGGRVRAEAQKEQAIASYLSDPNYCKFCGKAIPHVEGSRVFDTRRKTFCDNSCATSHNNTARSKNGRSNQLLCKGCGGSVSRGATECQQCSRHKKIIERGEVTKGEVHRTAITKHARSVFECLVNHNECQMCGYSLHIQICHIKPVSDFDDDTKLSEINDPINLIGLCPNHHWELDNGLLKLQD